MPMLTHPGPAITAAWGLKPSHSHKAGVPGEPQAGRGSRRRGAGGGRGCQASAHPYPFSLNLLPPAAAPGSHQKNEHGENPGRRGSRTQTSDADFGPGAGWAGQTVTTFCPLLWPSALCTNTALSLQKVLIGCVFGQAPPPWASVSSSVRGKYHSPHRATERLKQDKGECAHRSPSNVYSQRNIFQLKLVPYFKSADGGARGRGGYHQGFTTGDTQ